MKKTLLILSLVFVVGIVPFAHAAVGDPCTLNSDCTDATAPYCNFTTFKCQANAPSGNAVAPSAGFVPLTNIPGLTAGVTATQTGLATFLNNLYKYLIGLAAVLAVIEIIWGGLEISTKDSVSKHSDGVERITQAILGLILVLSPVLVFSIINPSILNLSLNLPQLAPVTAPPTGVVGSTGTTQPSTQCSVQGTAGIFQIATCPSVAAATTWGQSCTGALSNPTVITHNADGTPGQESLSCSTRNVFEFIDINTSLFGADTIDGVQPLAVANNSTITGNGSNTLYQTNGSDAVQYAQTCNSLGLVTCINTDPVLNTSYRCNPLPTSQLPSSAPAPAKCYTETLSCTNVTAGGVLNSLCSKNPSWAPFQ